jgi:hypothetical protein
MALALGNLMALFCLFTGESGWPRTFKEIKMKRYNLFVYIRDVKTMNFCQSIIFIHLRNQRIVIPFKATSYNMRRRGDTNTAYFPTPYRITRLAKFFTGT